MEALKKRAIYATRNQAKKHAKRQVYLDKAHDTYRRRALAAQLKHQGQIRSTNKRRQREAFTLGPLAPRYDVGEQKELYGTLPASLVMIPPLVSHKKPTWFHITAGDRVAIIRGRDKGHIGLVNRLNEDSATVQVNDMNVHDVAVPEWMIAQNDNGRVAPVPIEIPLADTRLVYPLINPDTGEYEDTIIEELTQIPSKKSSKDAVGKRVIAGTKIVIPWPKEYVQEEEHHAGDTDLALVRKVTFVPHLLMAPMPVLLIDELRNKYSKFRRVHDDDYVAKVKEREEQIQKRKGLIKDMQTPTQALAALRLQKKREAEQELNEAQLAKIGSIILSERSRPRAAAAQLLRED